jgi:hypothetical protein
MRRLRFTHENGLVKCNKPTTKDIVLEYIKRDAPSH